jgi:nucleoside-diphosphate-sugar epimerase
MVYVSSSMVFESTDRFPSREVDLPKIPPPVSAYGFSKLSGEWYCRAFCEEYGLKYSICRPFNAYGVNEFPGEEVGYAHVIPDLIKKVLADQYPLELLGDGQQTRCFTHVKDLANGIITVLSAKEAENEDFNVGTDRETKMIDLARMIWRLSGQKKEFKVRCVPGYKHDIKRRVPDVSKMRRLLGWEAKIPLEEGLPEIIDWLRGELK